VGAAKGLCIVFVVGIVSSVAYFVQYHDTSDPWEIVENHYPQAVAGLQDSETMSSRWSEVAVTQAQERGDDVGPDVGSTKGQT